MKTVTIVLRNGTKCIFEVEEEELKKLVDTFMHNKKEIEYKNSREHRGVLRIENDIILVEEIVAIVSHGMLTVR